MLRTASPTTLAVGSLVVFAGLVVALWWRETGGRAGPSDRPLVVSAAPTVRLPLEALAVDYERETGRPVELRFGPSEDILTRIRVPSPVKPADLFIPADDSYVREAIRLGLVSESIPLVRVRAVVLLAKGNPRGIASWADLLKDGVRVAVPNSGAAVGRVAREHLANTRKWAALAPHVVDTLSVTEAANATRIGGEAAVDAAIVWDAVAAAPAYNGQTVLLVDELKGADGRIEVAVLNQSRDRVAALAFARYIAAPAGGLVRFREFRFRVVGEPGPGLEGAKP